MDRDCEAEGMDCEYGDCCDGDGYRTCYLCGDSEPCGGCEECRFTPKGEYA